MIHRLLDISLIDTISISRNPRGYFLFGYKQNVYLAATGLYENKGIQFQSLPNVSPNCNHFKDESSIKDGTSHIDYCSVVDSIIGGDVNPEIHHFNILPCNPLIWPMLRDAANIVQPGLWSDHATFEDHLIQAVEGLLAHANYELDTFPSCMYHFARAKRGNGELSFERHYREVLLQPSGKQSMWICWGYLIRQGIPLCASRYPENNQIQSLLEPQRCMLASCFGTYESPGKLFHCSQCGWKLYCCRDHQVSDWQKHKKECYPYH